MKKPPYRYLGKVTRVVDGDTVDVQIDLGFRLNANVRCRLYGINTPERGELGYHEATDYLETQVHGKTLFVETHKDPDNFGRWLVELYDGPGESVNERLVHMGHAKEYRRT